MRLTGRRIHIAGSAATSCPAAKLTYGHDLIAAITQCLAKAGAAFAVGVGREPRKDEGDPKSSLIFDWTVLETLGSLVEQGIVESSVAGRLLVRTIATDKTDFHLPLDRRPLWDRLLSIGAIELTYTNPGSYSGYLRHMELAKASDILLLLSGGAGVEEMAGAYVAAGKPVIAIDLDLGSSMNDGSGGASGLAKTAIRHPDRFFRLTEPARAPALLRAMTTSDGGRPVSDVVAGIAQLLDALQDPEVFCIRLLDPEHEDFSAVDKFFSSVVHPVIARMGYHPVQMGVEISEHPWMNQEIFERLHHAAGAVVDLTGTRPSCYMELGYALCQVRQLVVTAMEKTKPAFDAFALQTHYWDPSSTPASRRADLITHWNLNFQRPPLVPTRQMR